MRLEIVRAWRRLKAVPFASVIGLLGINSALTFFSNPILSPLHDVASPWDYLWALQYGIGGAMMVLGIAGGWDRVEASGCVAFAGGAIINAFVLLSIFGLDRWNSVATLVLFAIAAGIRVKHIADGRVLVLTAKRGRIIADRQTGEVPKVS